jgi:CheY-like chemotaxis protein
MFTLKKGEKVSLSSCGFLQLSVADTGAGMSNDQMSDVFEQGTQFNVNELQAGQGSGLGLYIAKGIIDQHLGSLTVSSEGFGKGTVFTMTVPVYRDTKESDEHEENDSDHFHFKANKAITQPLQHGSNLCILVVDDSDTNRKFLTRILQNHGHTCDQAGDGSEAVEMVSESMGQYNDSKHYDAVLLDYEMPIMNGPTAAKMMRDLGSDTFIVGITGNLLPEDIEHFRSQGANEVLPKPFNISDLEEILMEYGVGFWGK